MKMATHLGTGRLLPILAFGDSLTEGYHRMGYAFHPYTTQLLHLLQNLSNSNFEVVNTGVSGETTGSMISRLESELTTQGPFQLGIILGGTNDLGLVGDEDAKSLFSRLKKLHEMFLNHTREAKSVAITIPETGYEHSVPSVRNKRMQVNELLDKYAGDSNGRVLLCDLARELPRESLGKELMDKFWDDGLHLSAEGYDRMGEIVFQTIKDWATSII